MRNKFFTWLCRWSFKKVAFKLDLAPIGLPYVRDAEHSCDNYMPIKSKMYFGWNGCEGDWHYLCQGCGLYNKKPIS